MTKTSNEPATAREGDGEEEKVEKVEFQDPTPELELLAIDLDSDDSDSSTNQTQNNKVDVDNYAHDTTDKDPTHSAAASRTYQSEEAFQAQKASYTAKHDDNSSYAELLEMFPALAGRDRISSGPARGSTSGTSCGETNGDWSAVCLATENGVRPEGSSHQSRACSESRANADADANADANVESPREKIQLDKRAVQRLGYAVGELYLDGRYEEITALCERTRRLCAWRDPRLREDLRRWEERCGARMAERDI